MTAGKSQLEPLGWGPFFANAVPPAGVRFDRPARITGVEKGYWFADSGEGEPHLATLTGKFRETAVTQDALPAVGDWIGMDIHPGGANIVWLFPRRTMLIRKAAGRDSAPQLLAANVDTALVVTSMDDDFSPARLERYLAVIREGGVRPVILLSKADRCDDPAPFEKAAKEAARNVPVHLISAKTGSGLDDVAVYLTPASTTVLIGSSGVGKSTLMNRLAGSYIAATREVRESDHKGRHTTTSRNLYKLPSGALIIDTPGMRELALWESASGLKETFEDIERLASGCRFTDCTHDTEPGCAVKAAIESGALDRRRLESWHKLRREAARSGPDAKQKAKQREKQISKRIRQFYRDRDQRDEE
ncbi:MAG: ribosome small subunit-dependent GTPase A [Deltaproteobacteria bacterium]|nr:ribosome small subunit-dependent GTPase A [Deltaproteobacteria bacterium]